MTLGLLVSTLVVDCLVEVGKNHQVIYDGPSTEIPNNIKDLTIREWLLEYDDILKEYTLYTQVY